jgi:hypothetical protein
MVRSSRVSFLQTCFDNLTQDQITTVTAVFLRTRIFGAYCLSFNFGDKILPVFFQLEEKKLGQNQIFFIIANFDLFVLLK